MTFKKTLIEVALTLDTINTDSAREKFMRHGHPSTLNLLWAWRPLAVYPTDNRNKDEKTGLTGPFFTLK